MSRDATSLPDDLALCHQIIREMLSENYNRVLTSDRWTAYTWVAGIEPTNNDAERVLRHAVLWRKSSGGTDSEAGSRFVERMLSVVATARQQNRNVLELLTACCSARLDDSAAPSLLPATAEVAAA